MAELKLDHVTVNVPVATKVKTLLQDVTLTVKTGEFVTVLGHNGAGKSTLFNAITGDLPVSGGTVTLAGQTLNGRRPEQRARHIARVFQDPKMGTAPRMTVAENLLLASHRGQRLGLRSRGLNAQKAQLKALAAKTGNGLAEALDKPTEQLSGGQRQAVSLLMATMRKPDLLLLDEHTAALDPHTSQAIMALTNAIVSEQQLTCLMITHQVEDALRYGNRLIVLDAGQIVADFDQKRKAALKRADVLAFFN
ncbi:ABC transporter ATP-binding protein [Lacticaseibacillus rhamnosus]|uniref:ABC transporter ATP-binding protein n=1 Tax=Lacticaseibacillus rhamnosus TaxID=47715 RepID=UPI0019521DEF|nr:ATP-binding cassette domain-containing protein [Lacticaseibacillus rhamnosus]MBM6406171.1 ATP-binding cassette domain-containing protein [Lacticaseibacillus rhamnosus]